jgi:hypothetical protein
MEGVYVNVHAFLFSAIDRDVCSASYCGDCTSGRKTTEATKQEAECMDWLRDEFSFYQE